MLFRLNTKLPGLCVCRIVALSIGAQIAFGPGMQARGGDLPSADVPVQLMEQRLLHDVQPFLEAYCFKCHGNGKHKGDVTLDEFKSVASILKDRKTWQAVHD